MNEITLNVVLIEDREEIRSLVQSYFKNHHLRMYYDVLPFLSEKNTESPDLILMDLWVPRNGQEVCLMSAIPEVRARYSNAELVIESGVEDVESMRESIRQGAARFVMKDHLNDELPLLVARMVEIKSLYAELDKKMLGISPALQQLKREIMSLRFQKQVDILVEGETGSGKELCAQFLHTGGPFVAVNVSAISAELFEAEFFGADKGAYTGAQQSRMGFFEAAGSGTLFLDEIQSMPLAQQAKLLRVLETRQYIRVGSNTERPFHARVVSASNVNLREAVSKGRFREDLYYRLSALHLNVAPLRQRKGDIAFLCQSFLKTFDEGAKNRSPPKPSPFLKTTIGRET